MKYFMSFIFIVAGFMATAYQVQAAEYLSFTQEGNSLTVGEYTNSFIQYTDGSQELTLSPSFHATSEKFAFIIPVPARPFIQPSKVNLFKELFGIVGGRVSVGDTNPVGTVEAFGLKTRFAESVTSWLDELGLSYSEEQLATLKKYLNRGDHLVLVSVSLPETTLTDEEGYYGTVSPVTFRMTTDKVIIPTYTNLASPETVKKNNYFTLGKDLYAVNGGVKVFQKIQGETCAVTKTCFTNYGWGSTSDSLTWLSYQTYDSALTTGNSNLVLAKSVPQATTAVTPGTSTGTNTTATGTTTISNTNSLYPALLNSIRLLKRGVSGNDVKDLQSFLNKQLSLNLVADGQWGSKTEVAVSVFQTKYKLKVDGIVGIQTRGFISQLLAQ